MIDLNNIVGFEWDKWNIDKSYKKHGITPNETEEVFLDENVKIEKDLKHQEQEERYIAIGKITENKILFVVFTIRKDKIRVVSGRQANKKGKGGVSEELKNMKQLKQIPKFKNEAEERNFWQTNDSTEYVDYTHVENWKFPNLKLTSKPITIRLPQTLIDRVKIKAHQMDVPYQTLIKKLIFEGIAK